MTVNELAAIVRIQPSQGKGELLLDGRQRLEDAVLAFAPHGRPLHSTRVNVHGIQGVQEVARPDPSVHR